MARTLLYSAVMEWQWRKVGRTALVGFLVGLAVCSAVAYVAPMIAV